MQAIFYCVVESSFLTMCVFPSGNDQQGVGSIIKRCRTDLYQCIKLLLFLKKKKKSMNSLNHHKVETMVSISFISQHSIHNIVKPRRPVDVNVHCS